MTVAHRLRRALWRFGIDVRRTSEVGPARLLIAQGVDLVLDVGANAGDYGESLRRAGYRGAIHSFEPLPAAYTRLSTRAASDPAWATSPFALGPEDGLATLHIAGDDGHSSSILPALPRHHAAAPRAAVVGEVEVEVRRLDGVFDQVAGSSGRAFLKLDTQGYEGAVLDGAEGVVSRLHGIQVELSLEPLYEGAPASSEIVERLESWGMRLAGIEPGYVDPRTMELLQYDAIYVRNSARSA